MTHTCNYCGVDVDVTEAGDDPRAVADLLVAHLHLDCSSRQQAAAEADWREQAWKHRYDLPGTAVTSYFDVADLVSMSGVLVWTHHERLCRPPCTIHSPSAHHMRAWEQHWAQQFSAVFRRCPHGYFHVDPDDLRARNAQISHPCDGCCLIPREG